LIRAALRVQTRWSRVRDGRAPTGKSIRHRAATAAARQALPTCSRSALRAGLEPAIGWSRWNVVPHNELPRGCETRLTLHEGLDRIAPVECALL
jgi:hypothetical protein